MANIIVNPQSLQEEPTSELVSLQIFVDEADWRGFFDQVQVFRSRGTSEGPYEELTAVSMQAARVPQTAGPASAVAGAQVAVVGKTLELQVDERDDLVVTFTGSDPLTLAAAATQVTTQGQNKVRAWVDEDGQFVVATYGVGTGAVLKVVGGDAAPTLGLPLVEPSSLDYGEDARIPLMVGVTTYTFQDIRGSRSFFYKTRFLNKTNNAKSEYSQAFSADQAVGVSLSNLVKGYVCLVDAAGKPLTGRAVQLRVEYNGTMIEGKTVAGGSLVQYTDDFGRVEFTLVRGQYYGIAIPGTDLNRQILSPVDPAITSFNLLDANVGTGQDMFKAVVPNLVTAERRTL